MNPRKQLGSILSGLAFGVALAASAPSARANVYASNVKINGGMTNLSVMQGTALSISYILNEPATTGVTIKILSGTNAVRTLSLTNGAPGTVRGLNTVTWNGLDDNGQNLPATNYSVSITAAASGYPGWTVLTDDQNPGNYVWEPGGIGVNRNPRSPYYGRVFIASSIDHSASGNLPGDSVGILKLNADGSYADEGVLSTGGVAWNDFGKTPWKIRVSDDDQVYVAAFMELGNSAGDIYRFDTTISTNSMLHVFAPPADTSLGEWSGFCITGAGTNTVLWGADDRVTGSVGIKKFAVNPDGTFTPTNGTQIVNVATTSDLKTGPFAVAVDRSGAIYTVVQRDFQVDPLVQVLRFPAYDPSTNNGAAETQATWISEPGDDYYGARGIAVDPTGTYVAACFWGYLPFTGVYESGNVKVFNAANGTVVTNLDLGITFPTTQVGDPGRHMDTDCDWDAVGNLYYMDYWASCWRAFSPPGANQSTTVALPVVQITPLPAPTITSISVSNGVVTIQFTGGANEPVSAFGLYGSSSPSGPYVFLPAAVITGSNGHYQATMTTNGMVQFYDVQRITTTPQAPRIQQLTVSGVNVVITFTGAATDSASAFTVLSASTPNGVYTSAAGATITGSGGTFQATVPTNGPQQFYRIRR